MKKTTSHQKQKEIQKQISMYVPISQWRAIRLEAARQKIPMTELFRQWMSPGLRELLPDLPEEKLFHSEP